MNGFLSYLLPHFMTNKNSSFHQSHCIVCLPYHHSTLFTQNTFPNQQCQRHHYQALLFSNIYTHTKADTTAALLHGFHLDVFIYCVTLEKGSSCYLQIFNRSMIMVSVRCANSIIDGLYSKNHARFCWIP
jgi:hypothetical protein